MVEVWPELFVLLPLFPLDVHKVQGPGGESEFLQLAWLTFFEALIQYDITFLNPGPMLFTNIARNNAKNYESLCQI